MRNFFEMSDIAQEVAESLAESLDNQLGDCKDLAREGMLVGDMRACVIRTAVATLDRTPRLDYPTRRAVLAWFQSEYGICL